MSIVTRASKTSPLTWTEMDGNFTYLNGKVVSVKDYGAVGDGLTDDTIAVTNWLAACAGKLGYAPGGTYLTGSQSLPSNCEIFGDGPNSTIFKAKNSTNSDLFTVSAKSFVTFRNFRIEGNSANQSQGSGITVSGASADIVFENVLINDHYDFGFNCIQVTRLKITGCGGTNGKAGASSGAVRAAFLLGASTPTSANDVEITNCYASCSNSFVNGFMSEFGNNHRIMGCRTAVAYTGFKIKGDNVIVSGNYATGGFNGFQTQRGSHNLNFLGNTAYRCNDSGFFFNNADTANPLIGLSVTGNQAIENGQSPSSTSYGFAFEGTTSATVDQVIISNNIAIDNQGVKTQGRGISFGTNGTFSNVMMDQNFTKGNTADLNLGASLDLTTFTYGPHVGFDSGTLNVAGGQGRQSLRFWVNGPAAGAGVTLLSDGLSGRGMIMPKAGYLLGIYVKSSAAVTGASIIFFPRKNGSNFGSGLSVSSGTYNTQEETFQSNRFAAGDIITCVYSSTAGFLPTGTDNFDVTVVVVY